MMLVSQSAMVISITESSAMIGFHLTGDGGEQIEQLMAAMATLTIVII